MEINKLIEIVKEKISKEIILQEINVEAVSYTHLTLPTSDLV